MTPSIITASYPKFDRDDNIVGIRSMDAMNLVPFEFFPHYTPEPEYARELKKQSKPLKYPIYGVSDGGGITVDDTRLSFFGDVWGYFAGKQFEVSVEKKRKKR